MNFLDVLREECDITSAKNGCAPEGTCGCCTVLVDGRPVMACLRKPEQMKGTKSQRSRALSRRCTVCFATRS